MTIASSPIASGSLAASSSLNYSIQVVSATFTLSMQGAGKLITDVYPSGEFILDGRAIGFTAQRPANFDSGTFSLTGQDVILDQNFGLIVDATYNNAAFTYSGQDVVLDSGFGIVLPSEAFSLTGADVNFKIDLNLLPDVGAFNLTGQNAFKGVSEVFDVGSFTYSGQDVALFIGRFIDAASGQYSYSFEDFRVSARVTIVVPPEAWTETADVPVEDPWTETTDVPVEDPWTEAA